MLYQVYGPQAQGVVVVEGYKKANGTLRFDFISCDPITGPNKDQSTILVYGDENKMNVRSEMREFVNLNRRYVDEEE